MGYITKNWSGFKNSLSLSEKVLDKVKPGTSLKNRLQDSQKKLQLQISKLEETHRITRTQKSKKNDWRSKISDGTNQN